MITLYFLLITVLFVYLACQVLYSLAVRGIRAFLSIANQNVTAPLIARSISITPVIYPPTDRYLYKLKHLLITGYCVLRSVLV